MKVEQCGDPSQGYICQLPHQAGSWDENTKRVVVTRACTVQSAVQIITHDLMSVLIVDVLIRETNRAKSYGKI